MINGKLINKYIVVAKSEKPKFITVSDDQWAEALEGYAESLSNAIDEYTPTEELWKLIYFSAITFCKGMQRQQEIDGKTPESLYPRY